MIKSMPEATCSSIRKSYKASSLTITETPADLLNPQLSYGGLGRDSGCCTPSTEELFGTRGGLRGDDGGVGGC